MSSTQLLRPRLKQAFADLIADRIGLTLRKNDQTNFQDFISNRLSVIGFDVPEKYYLLLNENTARSYHEWELLILAITNTESFFFRDQGQFNLLKNYILPTLIEQKSRKKSLRICSAGCSTGEEPYSLAILLTELIPDLKAWDLKILGIDINSTAIEKARAGLYRPWSFRGVDRAVQSHFFSLTDNDYQINDAIQKMVDFKVVNLIDSSFLDPTLNLKDMDLILCRNVFIYFSDSAIEKTLNKFYDALCPLGYLLVGHAELHNQRSNKLHTKIFNESIAYQRPADNTTQTISEFIPTQMPPPPKKITENSENQDLDALFKGSDIKMKQVALNLLRQLPNDSRIAKLGNRKASELILQLENNLKEIG
ncbi:MAG: protein-glutamate O-methyltransferase CheR [Leptolyngbya sp. SIO3F4]|nr:protein-glutamate O-methyltransferase CheR [Leptolyngbya sp. SIO3F4]